MRLLLAILCLLVPVNGFSSSPKYSQEQQFQYDLMGSAGGYFQVPDLKDQEAVMEQTYLIEMKTRLEITNRKLKKESSSSTSKAPESKKAFGDSHVDAALSIIPFRSDPVLLSCEIAVTDNRIITGHFLRIVT